MSSTETSSGVETQGIDASRESYRFGLTASLSIAYLVLAIGCLIQWQGVSLWRRLDLLSGGYFALRFLGSVFSLVSSRRVFQSQPLRREWWGQTSNPGIVRWVILLMICDLAVFLDYGHWHLVRALDKPFLRGLGLGLYLVSVVWQIWTDSYLARHFRDGRASETPTVVGPFRHIRHPRYGAAILGKLALALVFASVLGWLMLLPWTLLLLDKVRAEEAHLHRVFGPRYEVYASKTARLLPGVY